jgi:hypothetical protein
MSVSGRPCGSSARDACGEVKVMHISERPGTRGKSYLLGENEEDG